MSFSGLVIFAIVCLSYYMFYRNYKKKGKSPFKSVIFWAVFFPLFIGAIVSLTRIGETKQTQIEAREKTQTQPAVGEMKEPAKQKDVELKLENKPIIEVSQYSRITPEALTKMLGDPKGIYDEKWKNPATGQEFEMKTYDYEVNGYYTEFLIIENAVVRMNVYASDNKVNQFVVEENTDIFGLIGIQHHKTMRVVIDNAVAARYSSVSDSVGEVWALLDEGEVDTLKITFDLEYFN